MVDDLFFNLSNNETNILEENDENEFEKVETQKKTLVPVKLCFEHLKAGSKTNILEASSQEEEKSSFSLAGRLRARPSHAPVVSFPDYYDGSFYGSILTLDPEVQNKVIARYEIQTWYPFHKDKYNKVKIKLPGAFGRIRGLIYVIYNSKEERYLIGQTGQPFSRRLSGYTQMINKKTARKAKEAGQRAFLKDFKAHPNHFRAAIFYRLHPEDDIQACEELIIKHKKTVWELYNDREGGGGSLAHSSEIQGRYVIPNDPTYTPEKYYPARVNAAGKTRFEFSPGFHERIKGILLSNGNIETFAYSIKHLPTGRRYIGVTCNPEKRAYEHQLMAEYADPAQEKYDPSMLTGVLHFEIAEAPQDFAFGLFPLRSAEEFDSSKDHDCFFPVGRAQLEKVLIALKESLVDQQGMNANRGGGGGIGSSSSSSGRAQTTSY